MKKVSVVIVTYNGEKYIRKCLDSIVESACIIEVIVVDNHSQDLTVDIIKNDYPNVKLISLNENFGFGKANNIGISESIKSKSDYILLLNQDAWITPSMIDSLVKQSFLNLNFGILSPVHWCKFLEILDCGFKKYTNYEIGEAKMDEVIAVNFICAAIWLVPTFVFKKVGGFDPMFAHYGEDVDFVNRVRYHGYSIGYCPNINAVHDREQNPKYDENRILRGIYIYIYILLKDINVRFPISLAKTFYYTLSQIVKQPKLCCPILVFFVKSILISPKIYKVRNMLKTTGSYFLDV